MGCSSGGGSMSAWGILLFSFSGSGVSSEIEGDLDGPEVDGISRDWAFKVTCRSSGWLTVTNSDELDEAELEACWELVGGGRAMRNPVGMREHLGWGAALGECWRFVMGVKYFTLKNSAEKEWNSANLPTIYNMLCNAPKWPNRRRFVKMMLKDLWLIFTLWWIDSTSRCQ